VQQKGVSTSEMTCTGEAFGVGVVEKTTCRGTLDGVRAGGLAGWG
jgi:hypothetical protein